MNRKWTYFTLFGWLLSCYAIRLISQRLCIQRWLQGLSCTWCLFWGLYWGWTVLPLGKTANEVGGLRYHSTKCIRIVVARISVDTFTDLNYLCGMFISIRECALKVENKYWVTRAVERKCKCILQAIGSSSSYKREGGYFYLFFVWFDVFSW